MTLAIGLTQLAKWYNKAKAALEVSDDGAVYASLMHIRDELEFLIDEELGPDEYEAA
jgi:hypothetical protein